MQNNPRSLIEMGLNSASMAAFMMPGPGPAVGMVLMSAPILMNLFFPIEDNIDPEHALPTNADLKNALNDLRRGVAKDIFDNEMVKNQAHLLTLYNSIEKVWSASVDDANGIRSQVERGPIFLSSTVTPKQEEAWLQRYERFKEPLLDKDSPIRLIKNWIELNPRYKTETLPLYIFAGSLWNMYCRFNLAWEYNQILRKYREAVDEHSKEVANMNLDKALVKWELVGKAKGEPKPAYPPKPPVPPELKEIQKYSQFCSLVQDFTPDFIDYAKPIALGLKANFASRKRQVERRLAKLDIRERGSGRRKSFYYYDSQTGVSSKPVRVKRLAEAKMRAKQGALRNALWKKITREQGLDKISETEVDQILSTIKLWETTVKHNQYR